jgi:nitrogen fixation protein NifU and related proteins
MAEGAPYSAVIIEHFRRPRNYGALLNASAAAEAANPLCGDRIRIALRLDEAARISDARFTANACAICVAAASLLTDALRGMSHTAAARLDDDQMLALIGGGVPPARRRCATLPLEALRKAMAATGAEVRGDDRARP